MDGMKRNEGRWNEGRKKGRIEERGSSEGNEGGMRRIGRS